MGIMLYRTLLTNKVKSNKLGLKKKKQKTTPKTIWETVYRISAIVHYIKLEKRGHFHPLKQPACKLQVSSV